MDVTSKAASKQHTMISKSPSNEEGIVEEVELKQRFSLLGIIGIQISCVATLLAIGGYINLSLGLGGSAFFFSCYIVSFFFQMMVCLSLAEIASAYPHALGQVFWTAALSPPRWTRSLSYWNGVTTTLIVHFTNAATWALTATVFAATISVLTNGGYTAKAWHTFLYLLAFVILSTTVNIWTLNAFAKLASAMAGVILCVTIFIAVALLVKAHPKQSAHDVFLQVTNESGWSSSGLVFLMALLPGATSVAGFGFAAHLTEEVPNPARNIPIVMVSVAFFGGLTGLLMVIALLFCTVNPTNLLTPIGGFAMAQLCWDAFDSLALTGISVILLLLTYFIGSISLFTSTSRVTWSFAKHNGYAFSSRLGHVDEKSQIPINAVLATAAVTILLCLLMLGPATAMSALFNSIFLSTWADYGMPIWLLILQGRQILPEDRYLHLGRLGLAINVVAVAWQLLLAIFLPFPQFLPLTANTMNYAAPVFVAVVILFGVN
ncbi:putative amino acid transporter [Tothia fuscella]|uniref:Amino acid transporter n=1 Tax=Tothia fuscella TaxID=1048955 RepID=A0A9P4NTZ8_9PEZI|nr:putative amino acid transporter [Tothia fuscella]